MLVHQVHEFFSILHCMNLHWANNMQFNGDNYDEMDQNLSPEERQCIYGKPDQVIQFMDYTDGGPLDNSRYVPKLVPGMLQLLEEFSEEDKYLSTIDIEAIVKEAEKTTEGLPPQTPSEKDLKRFGKPISKEKMHDVCNKSFSTTTKKKALWARYIFDQWKCIHNYKLKADKSLNYSEIKISLINMELDQMCDILC